ncbi:hypothetical protein Abr02nite_77720 [Paractinoplanes brasiliensis]|nr:hypothetical protein Abr02nite_77720 [Actinoplanes brasiliensis]
MTAVPARTINASAMRAVAETVTGAKSSTRAATVSTAAFNEKIRQNSDTRDHPAFKEKNLFPLNLPGHGWVCHRV